MEIAESEPETSEGQDEDGRAGVRGPAGRRESRAAADGAQPEAAEHRGSEPQVLWIKDADPIDFRRPRSGDFWR